MNAREKRFNVFLVVLSVISLFFAVLVELKIFNVFGQVSLGIGGVVLGFVALYLLVILAFCTAILASVPGTQDLTRKDKLLSKISGLALALVFLATIQFISLILAALYPYIN